MKHLLPTTCATLALLGAPLALHAESRVEWIEKNVKAEAEKQSNSKSSSDKKKSSSNKSSKPNHPPGPPSGPPPGSGGHPDKKNPPKPPKHDGDKDHGKPRPDDRDRDRPDVYRRDDVWRGGGYYQYPPAPPYGYSRYPVGPGWGAPSATIIRVPSYETRRVYSYEDRDPGTDLGYAVQSALARRGYRIGPIDGVMGSRTRAALADFQDRCGIPPTGRIDEPTLRALDLVVYR